MLHSCSVSLSDCPFLHNNLRDASKLNSGVSHSVSTYVLYVLGYAE